MNMKRVLLMSSLTVSLLSPLRRTDAFQISRQSFNFRSRPLRRIAPPPSRATLFHNNNNDYRIPHRRQRASRTHLAVKTTENIHDNSNNNNHSHLQQSASTTPPHQRTLRALSSSAVLTFLLASTLAFLVTPAPPANAALGAAGGAVTSPAIVDSITLEDWLNLPLKKQRQYEGGFLSCKTVVSSSDEGIANAKRRESVTLVSKSRSKIKKASSSRQKDRVLCQPVNLGNELLEAIDALARENPEKSEQFRAGAQNIIARQRLIDRKEMEKKLSMQPDYVNFGCAFLASCVSTLIVHPLDTLKVRLMSGKATADGDNDDDDNSNNPPPINSAAPTLRSISSLYDGILPNIAKEAPASALYLGIYESTRAALSTIPFFQSHILLNYLLAGSVGELVGSICRSPAEAIKTRVQTGQYDVGSAMEYVFLTEEGRRNTFDAWFAGVFRDIPHGAIQIAVFEFSKILIVNSAVDVDVNTLFSEAVLGGFGGGLGALISTPSDVVVVNVMTSMNEGKSQSAVNILTKIWNEDGVGGLFSGFAERISYWAIAVGIFLSVYCSLRQYSLTIL